MANTTTTNPAITSRYLAIKAAQDDGLASLATITGDTSIATPTTDTEGVPFYGLRTAVITAASVGDNSTATAYAMFRNFDGSFAWTQMSGAPTLTLTDGDLATGWNTDAGCPERVCVAIDAGAGATFTISIGGHQ